MRIKKSVYEEIATTFAKASIESGGILGRKKDTVCKFFFDGGGSATEYRIRTETLNPVIAEWAKNGILFAGIIHSHPNGNEVLSKWDKAYAEEILRAFPFLGYVLFPVVTVSNNELNIVCYRYAEHWMKEKLIEE